MSSRLNDFLEWEDDCVVDFETIPPAGKSWIYGVFSHLHGKCLYVGQTKNFRQRWNKHNNLAAKGKFDPFKPIVMLPLELCDSSIAFKRERYFQKQFEKIGMAQLSRAFWGLGGGE